MREVIVEVEVSVDGGMGGWRENGVFGGHVFPFYSADVQKYLEELLFKPDALWMVSRPTNSSPRSGRAWGVISHWSRPTMSVKTLIAIFATVAASFAAPPIVHAAQERPAMQTATPKPTKSGHAAVNGVNYYYAVYGKGEPLLLLHGGMSQ